MVCNECMQTLYYVAYIVLRTILDIIFSVESTQQMNLSACDGWIVPKWCHFHLESISHIIIGPPCKPHVACVNLIEIHIFYCKLYKLHVIWVLVSHMSLSLYFIFHQLKVHAAFFLSSLILMYQFIPYSVLALVFLMCDCWCIYTSTLVYIGAIYSLM